MIHYLLIENSEIHEINYCNENFETTKGTMTSIN